MFIAKHFWHQVLLLGLSINQSSFHSEFKLNCHCQSTVKFRIRARKSLPNGNKRRIQLAKATFHPFQAGLSSVASVVANFWHCYGTTDHWRCKTLPDENVSKRRHCVCLQCHLLWLAPVFGGRRNGRPRRSRCHLLVDVGCPLANFSTAIRTANKLVSSFFIVFSVF